MNLSIRRRACVALVAATLLIGLAACSSSGGPDASSTRTPKTASSTHEWDLAKAKCMRDAGFDYADPNPDGTGGGPQVVEGDNIESSIAAEKKCDVQLTAKLGERPVTDDEKKFNEAWLAHDRRFTDCLRKAGFDMPDDPFSYERSKANEKVTPEAMDRCEAQASAGDEGGAK